MPALPAPRRGSTARPFLAVVVGAGLLTSSLGIALWPAVDDRQDFQATPPERRLPAADAATRQPDVLRDEIVDVALLPPGGQDDASRLLTVALDPQIAGRTHLRVLERAAGRWSPRAAVVLDPPILGVSATPWLIPVDERRFVILAQAPDLGETWLQLVRWSGEELQVGPLASVGRLVDDAGTADVDGDGTRELVVAEARTRRGGPTCQGSTLAVLSLPELRVIDEHAVPELRLAAGTLAPVDDVPGDELVATAFRNCPAGPASALRLALTAIRLVDGSRLVDRSVEAADSLTAWSGRPSVVRLGGAREAATVLLGSGQGLLALSTAAGARPETFAQLPGVILGATQAQPGGPVVVAIARDDGIAAGILSAGEAGPALDVSTLAVPVGNALREAAALDVRTSALRQHAAVAWVMPDADGACPSLVVTLAVVGCDADGGASVRAGPAWFATRPLVQLRTGGVERLLVARADAWPGAPARLSAPAPAAAEPVAGGWRHGPSTPFTLAEADRSLLDGRGADPPAIDPLALGRPLAATIGAPAGTRIVIQTRPEAAAVPGLAPTLGRLLSTEHASQPSAATLDLLRADSPSEPPDARRGGPTAASPAIVRIPLLQGRPAGGGAAVWRVVAIAIGPLGDVSEAVTASVAQDVTAPVVAIEPPLVSAPWPFEAALGGRTEPDATVRAAGRDIPVEPDGSFTLRTALPPWPLRVALRIEDRSGNVTETRLDVVGGVDYRRLPWVWLLVGALTIGAVAGALRGREPRISTTDPFEVPAPPIEEVSDTGDIAAPRGRRERRVR